MSLDMTSEEQTAITETNQAITRPLRRTAHINTHCKERLHDVRQNIMNGMSMDKNNLSARRAREEKNVSRSEGVRVDREIYI